MLSNFDWLRRSRTGTELLASLQCLSDDPECFTTSGGEPGPVPTALSSPCIRCWIYPPAPESEYCLLCQAIRERGRRLGNLSRQALVIWGFVNWLPRQLRKPVEQQNVPTLGAYAPDANHFLVMIRRRDLQPWLQEIVLYHGSDLKGHIQIFPTIGNQKGMEMGDVLCRAISHETYFPMDKLRVRLYTRAYQVLRPHELDREGILTFEIGEFLSLLEMAVVFRSVVPPQEQEILHQLLMTDDEAEAIFYWGRLLGLLNQEVKDMLNAWQIRRWPRQQVKFFYELKRYVAFRAAY